MKSPHAWSEETLFTDGDAFFEDVLDSIQAAQRSIDLETYIFNKDRIGTKILNALIQATARGIEVRILMDGVGCFDWTPNEVMELRQKGPSVKIFHPLPWYQADTPEKFIKSWEKLERRDHRKCIIIDQQVAFCGSANITEVHCKSIMGEEAFRDICVKVQGPDMTLLQKEFDWMWDTASPLAKHTPPNTMDESCLVRANSSMESRSWLFKDLFHRITHAKERVWIMTPYFVPRLNLLYALRLARRNGVDVRLLLPSKSDIGQLRRLAHTFYSTLLKNKIRIFEYQATTLHAKVCLIDNWATVGSANFNHRSFIYDYELNVVLCKPETLEEIKQQFLNDFQRSEEIHAKKWNTRSLFDRCLETMVLPFKNWS